MTGREKFVGNNIWVKLNVINSLGFVTFSMVAGSCGLVFTSRMFYCYCADK